MSSDFYCGWVSLVVASRGNDMSACAGVANSIHGGWHESLKGTPRCKPSMGHCQRVFHKRKTCFMHAGHHMILAMDPMWDPFLAKLAAV